MRPANPLYQGLGTTIFAEMSLLATHHRAVNLGQGFPDDPGSTALKEEAARALRDGWNQYPPMMGWPALRQAVATHERRWYGLDLDWEREVLITSGATEALAAAILALVDTGDEVVIIEPAYDAYAPLVRRAGGRPRFVTLRGPQWTLDLDELRGAFGPRTKALLWNDPHNPTGRCATEDELARVAAIVVEHDAYVISDEVYEHIRFAPGPHRSLLQHPLLRDRVLKIGSAGKTFSVTGWKVGMVTGGPSLVGVVAKAHQFLTFATPPALQAAVAWGLSQDEEIRALSGEMQRRRDRLSLGLRKLGAAVREPEGTYFLNVEIGSLGGREEDRSFARRLTMEAGVATIPLSPFYEQEVERGLLRLCFAKQDAVLDDALMRLARWMGRPLNP